jgi:hypothetical protein
LPLWRDLTHDNKVEVMTNLNLYFVVRKEKTKNDKHALTIGINIQTTKTGDG